MLKIQIMTTEQSPRHEPDITKEIERKFLVENSEFAAMVDQGFDLDGYPHKKIDQGYLASTDDCEIRVRRKGDEFFLTYKSTPTDHVAERIELETELTQKQFDTMWPGTAGRRVEKTRYEIPAADGVHTIELDVFEGDNEGCILAEVEFASTAEADAFQPPAWFSIDVTADKGFGNASIAEHGFPKPYL